VSVAPGDAAFDVIRIGPMDASPRAGSRALRADGGAGGAGALKQWREYERPAGTSIAAIRASDTALTKAGVERGG